MFVLWAISVAVLFLGKQGLNAWVGFGVPIIILALVLLTNVLVRPGEVDAAVPRPHQSRSLIWAQLAVIVGSIALTGIRALPALGLDFGPDVPLWTQLLRGTDRIGNLLGIGGNQATNFMTYDLIPGVIVLLLRATLAEIGFARFGHGWTRIAFLWLVLPAIGWVVAFFWVHATFGFMLYQLFRNFLSNGFSEEFLWRGLLFTRLRVFLSDDWAAFLQALLFGAWHLSADYSAAHGNWLFIVATMIASQAVFGYAMAWLMLRTRNIALPTLYHLGYDSLGDAFGMK
jgi:membrane protease YdiL (CAAX protease family)